MSPTAKTTKTFDCIAFKRQAQQHVYEVTREMSDEQRRAYVQQLIESGPLARFWKKVIQKAPTAPRAGRI